MNNNNALALVLAVIMLGFCATAHAGTRTNGTRTNGTRTNGTRTNGTKFNGTRTNGTRTNGTRTNGTRTNGTRTNGTRTNGTRTNGTRTNGTRTNGTRTNGTRTNGINLNGTQTNRSQEIPALPSAANERHSAALVGVKTDAQTSEVSLVQVIGVRGDKVQALLWSSQAGWAPVELDAGELLDIQWVEAPMPAR